MVARTLDIDRTISGITNRDIQLVFQQPSTGTITSWMVRNGAISSTKEYGSVPTQYTLIGSGDVSSDGVADLIWQNGSTGALSAWYLNSADGFVSSGELPTAPLPWRLGAVGDLNADGRADLVWRNGSTGEVIVWLMNGATLASSASVGIVPLAWRIATAGDLSGDGKADLLWEDPSTGARLVWLMNGTVKTGTVDLGVVPSNWTIVAVGDYDDNGKNDIFWQDPSTSALIVWLMNGTTYVTSGSMPGSPPSPWRLRAVRRSGQQQQQPPPQHTPGPYNLPVSSGFYFNTADGYYYWDGQPPPEDLPPAVIYQADRYLSPPDTNAAEAPGGKASAEVHWSSGQQGKNRLTWSARTLSGQVIYPYTDVDQDWGNDSCNLIVCVPFMNGGSRYLTKLFPADVPGCGVITTASAQHWARRNAPFAFVGEWKHIGVGIAVQWGEVQRDSREIQQTGYPCPAPNARARLGYGGQFGKDLHLTVVQGSSLTLTLDGTASTMGTSTGPRLSSYSWQAGGLSVGTTPTTTLRVSSSKSFSLSVTDAFGATGTDYATVYLQSVSPCDDPLTDIVETECDLDAEGATVSYGGSIASPLPPGNSVPAGYHYVCYVTDWYYIRGGKAIYDHTDVDWCGLE